VRSRSCEPCYHQLLISETVWCSWCSSRWRRQLRHRLVCIIVSAQPVKGHVDSSTCVWGVGGVAWQSVAQSQKERAQAMMVEFNEAFDSHRQSKQLLTVAEAVCIPPPSP
jgi:hypothetical protein